MIGKPEIITIAGQLGLNPHIVEKDHALGWLLAAIFAHERLADSWLFKGGTCLKKCFFDTYRLSDDLDFTLKDESHLDEAFLKEVFAEIGEWVYDQSGLEMPADGQDFDLYENPRGNMNCQGRISYRGPVSPTTGGRPRIKLDLTADERLVLPPVRIPIFHPYGDAPDGGIVVQAYAYEEAFGEKVRALAERTRPRDLYDVVNLYRNMDARPVPSVLLDVLRQKCAFREIPGQDPRMPGRRVVVRLRPAGQAADALDHSLRRPLREWKRFPSGPARRLAAGLSPTVTSIDPAGVPAQL